MKPKGNSRGTSSLGSTWPADRAEPRNGWPQVLAGFFSAKNETAAKAKGVKRLCIPNRAIKSPERKREQKKRWFRTGQKWRTGCEGRISVVKRRQGLNRSRYKGNAGIQRWVGLGGLLVPFAPEYRLFLMKLDLGRASFSFLLSQPSEVVT